MRWNTPLSEDHATLLLEQLDVGQGARVLDLGCGWGALLLRAVGDAAASVGGPGSVGDGVIGVGVDTDAAALDRARALAVELGLGERVTFINQQAEAWTDPADRVICVGSSHALGGTEKMFSALAAVTTPGGRALVGDGCWERPPTDAAATEFDELVHLNEVVALAAAAGWRILHVSTADQREWDVFESTYRLGRQEWLLANPTDPRAQEVREELDAQLTEYLTVYRGILGFCYLVLGR